MLLLPNISVIVPCYNYAHFLPETLDSILSQTYSNWECIIVDDGSTDDTYKVVQQYLSQSIRFRYLYQENKGLSAARNAGIRIANGKYLQFLDADDLIEPRKIEFQVDYLEKHPEVDIIYGDIRYFPTYDRLQHSRSIDLLDNEWMPHLIGNGLQFQEIIVRKNIMPVNAPLVRSIILREVGLFDEKLRAFEDWHLWMKCIFKNKSFSFKTETGTLALIRVHNTSMTNEYLRVSEAEIGLRKRVNSLLKEFKPIGIENDIIITNKSLMYNLKGRICFNLIEKGRIMTGLFYAMQAAWFTNAYCYYFKNCAYWLRQKCFRFFKPTLLF